MHSQVAAMTMVQANLEAKAFNTPRPTSFHSPILRFTSVAILEKAPSVLVGSVHPHHRHLARVAQLVFLTHPQRS